MAYGAEDCQLPEPANARGAVFVATTAVPLHPLTCLRKELMHRSPTALGAYPHIFQILLERLGEGGHEGGDP